MEAPVSAALAASVLGSRAATSMPWHYEHGLFLMAAGRAGRVYGDERLLRAPVDYIDALVDASGRIEGYSETEHNLDQVNPGRLLLSHPESDSPRLRAAIETLKTQLSTQPRCPSGGYWHKKIYPDQMWLDGLYMAEPFSVACGRRYGEAGRFDDAVFQFELAESATRDARTGLLYHAWDESRRQLWSKPETGCSPNFWGRAIGWFAMALVDVLDYLPGSQSKHEALVAMLGRVLAAAMACQDPESGLWYQVVDQAGRKGNYLETSASAMLAYTGLKAARKGLVSDPAVRESALRAWEGIARLRLSRGAGGLELDGTCAVAGLGGLPYRDGSYEYYIGEPVSKNDHKGVGPFILASLEREAMAYPSVAERLRVAEEEA